MTKAQAGHCPCDVSIKPCHRIKWIDHYETTGKQGPVRSEDHMVLELQAQSLWQESTTQARQEAQCLRSTELGAVNGTRFGFRSPIRHRRGRQSNGAPDGEKALLILFLSPVARIYHFYLPLHPSP